jgi:inorganic triphosphatase YgiF
VVEEIELKLELTPDDADALEAADLFGGKPKVTQLCSTYFDTPEQGVKQAGFSLRIRRSGRKRVETVKANGADAAGLFARPEWERKVKSDAPRLDESTPLAAALGDKADRLRAIFRIDVTRQAWKVAANGAVVEIVLDRGTIVAGDREAPICEVEIELKDGPHAALFALARKIDAIVPVRLGVLSKGQRGYRLLASAPASDKAQGIALESNMDSAKAFQHIGQACLRHYRLNEQQLLNRHDAEVLHQARVAVRRMRSAFSIHRKMCGDSEFARLGDELRWLQAELGSARDLDVLRMRAPPGRVRDSIERAKNRAYSAVDEALASGRARALMIDLTEWIADGPWLRQADGEDARKRPATQFAADALDHFRKKVKKGGRHIETIDDDARHEVRKAAKKLRYSAEFYAGLYDRKRQLSRHKDFVAALTDLQDQLGALNDLVTAREVLDGLGLAKDPQSAKLLGATSKPKLLKAASDACDKMIEADPFWP